MPPRLLIVPELLKPLTSTGVSSVPPSVTETVPPPAVKLAVSPTLTWRLFRQSEPAPVTTTELYWDRFLLVFNHKRRARDQNHSH